MERYSDKWRDIQTNGEIFRQMERYSDKCRDIQRNGEIFR
jgi:hypothetical protein